MKQRIQRVYVGTILSVIVSFFVTQPLVSPLPTTTEGLQKAEADARAVIGDNKTGATFQLANLIANLGAKGLTGDGMYGEAQGAAFVWAKARQDLQNRLDARGYSNSGDPINKATDAINKANTLHNKLYPTQPPQDATAAAQTRDGMIDRLTTIISEAQSRLGVIVVEMVSLKDQALMNSANQLSASQAALEQIIKAAEDAITALTATLSKLPTTESLKL